MLNLPIKDTILEVVKRQLGEFDLQDGSIVIAGSSSIETLVLAVALEKEFCIRFSFEEISRPDFLDLEALEKIILMRVRMR